jgi:hypothetical protein
VRRPAPNPPRPHPNPARPRSYEFCHRTRVHQFHKDGTTGVQDPDWSLGDFDAVGRVERAARPPSALPGYYASHFFVGGQRCDETGRGRASEVQFFCCPYARAVPVLEDVEEPATCRYRLKVCVPSLCVSAAGAAPPQQAQQQQQQQQPQGEASGALTPERLGELARAAREAAATARVLAGAAAAERAAFEAAAAAAARRDAAEAQAAASAAGAAGAASRAAAEEAVAATGEGKGEGEGTGADADGSESFDPERLPPVFVAAAWHTLLGDNGAVFRALEGPDLSSGIALVRF